LDDVLILVIKVVGEPMLQM